MPGCMASFCSPVEVKEHARNHHLQEAITQHFYTINGPGLPPCPPTAGDCCPHEDKIHYHCKAVSYSSCWHALGRDNDCSSPVPNMPTPFRHLVPPNLKVLDSLLIFVHLISLWDNMAGLKLAICERFVNDIF